MNWNPPAYQAIRQGNYTAVAQIYEQAIETDPETISNYWYLGLAYLLLEKEEEAQSTWIYALTQGTPEDIERGVIELANILSEEATRQESLKNHALAWLIRGHLQTIDPSLINNLLHLIKLDIILENYTPEKLDEWQVIESIQNSDIGKIDSDLLIQTLGKIIEFPALETIAFVEASLPHIKDGEKFIDTVMSVANNMAYDQQKPTYAADLTKLCVQLYPENPYLLNDLLGFYGMAKKREELLKLAAFIYEKIDEFFPTISLKVYGTYRVLLTLMGAGAWLQINPIVERYKTLLSQMIQEPPKVLEPILRGRLLGLAVPLSYLSDNLRENRYFTNQLAQLFYKNLPTWLPSLKKVSKIKKQEANKPLKIGYIAHTLRQHSVGWLSRWLFHYHDRNKFKIALYMINQPEDELTQNWFRNNADIAYNFPRDPATIAKQIQTDKIDILVDLDSLTHNLTYQVMALKPAPIQITWLGFDGSGLPTIDYFIVDNYVVPENAQEYYQETLWRLPQTYIAVDGFEVGTPTLTREQLEIPADATIYLSVQNGLKRHPDTIRLQMQILQAVPNSYFLIKGAGNDTSIQQLFTQLAQKYQITSERLKFLQQDTDELTHRANLQIADIILDTYPYNGATTTLEILWMGIPLVTKVGQQFSARNSYAFMTNVGLTEGIAWTDEEYIEWGIKLGQDANLRQQIKSKLQLSRQTSPLWNGEEFYKWKTLTYKCIGSKL